MDVMAETLRHVSESNVQLRSEVADAVQKSTEAAKSTAAAEQRAEELRTLHDGVCAELKNKGTEISSLKEKATQLREDADAKLVVAEEKRESAEAAQRTAEEALVIAREAESCAKASCHLKSEEVLALQRFIASLQAEAKQGEVSLAAARRRAEIAEAGAADAVRLTGEMDIMAETLRHVSESNVQLRSEVADAGQKSTEAAARVTQ